MAFNFKIEQAVREKVYVKLALLGPSGCGKSYSALRLATGMIDQMKKRNLLEGTNGKILFANTEGPRGRYYASEFKYDIVNLEPPYAPEMFTELINAAVEQKYSVLIIDSSSAEWEGRGGCLELQQQAGGKYQDWSKITPRHDKFIDTMALSPIHIIATMKGKDQYEVDKDDRGRVSVKKLGVGAKQRDGFEYNFTSTFMLDRDSHMAKSEKDNTHIFEREGMCVLEESHGAKIIDWANDSDVENTSAVFTPATPDMLIAPVEPSANELNSVLDSIGSLIESLKQKGIDRKDIASVIASVHIVNGKGTANYRTITDMNVANQVIGVLETM